jgi:hypothetical protein
MERVEFSRDFGLLGELDFFKPGSGIWYYLSQLFIFDFDK